MEALLMFKHSKGYRPVVASREIALGGINALAFASGLSFICPALWIASGPLHTGDAPVPPPYWAAVGIALVLVNVGAMAWSVWVNRNLQKLQDRPHIWVISVLILLVVLLIQWPTIREWFSLYLD